MTLGHVVLDSRYSACIDQSAELQCLWTGGQWLEGPAWLEQSGTLIYSDIPNNRMLCWHSIDNTVTEFRNPSLGANGSTVDAQGRLITCEQYSRCITRTEYDGSRTVLASHFNGKRFNAPNDIVVKSDGTIWFSDPDYGQSADYEGILELDGCHVYCFDPCTESLTQKTTDFVMPNGLAFSRDESLLYIIDTGSTHLSNGPNHIRRFNVTDNNTLQGSEIFARNAANGLDGLRVDLEGRLWCSAEDGVHCYHHDGTLLGKIILPARAGNLCFGDSDLQTLFMCVTDSLFMLRLAIRG